VSWQDVQARTGLSRSRAYTLLREERARLAASNRHQPTLPAQTL
jgi:predicted DNA-binding transcriptional regulator AlpA